MPRIQLRSLVTAEALGAIAGAILVGISLAVPPPAREVVAAVAASFIFAACFLLLQALHKRYFDTDSRRFFGDEMMAKGTIFVFPDFELAPEVRDTLASHNPQRLYTKPMRHFAATTHRIDIPRAVAANDMEALVYLSGLFEASRGHRFELRTDSTAVHQCDCSFISVGLSSNDCTHLYLSASDCPMFEIVPDEQDSEYVRLVDGREFRSDAQRQMGLILRYAPEPVQAPDRRWFLVAGVGPIGTIGAARYLAQCWRHLHREVGDRDFVAVISVLAATERSVRLEAICTEDPTRAVAPLSREPEALLLPDQ